MNIASKLFMLRNKSSSTEPEPDLFEDAVDFNHSGYLALGNPLNGVVDSDKFIVSFWIRSEAYIDNNDISIIKSDNNRFEISLNRVTTNLSYPRVVALDTSGSVVVDSGDLTSNDHINTSSALWSHVLIAVDLSGVPVGAMYINDIKVQNFSNLNAGVLDFTSDDWMIGANNTFSVLFAGSLQFVYFAPGQYLDISHESLRRRFTKYNDKNQLVPVSMGKIGDLPTGTIPAIYLPLVSVESANINSGLGGNFITNGDLKLASKSATDDSVASVIYGGNTYLYTNSINVVSNSTKLTISFFFRPKQDDRTMIEIQDSSGNSRLIVHMVDDKFTVAIMNTVPYNVQEFESSGVLNRLTWQHILISIDTVTLSQQLYINDVSNIVPIDNSAGTLGLDTGTIRIGTGFNETFNESISELYIEPGLWLDLSLEANRRKFINADLTPANTRQLNIVDGLDPSIYLPNSKDSITNNEGTGSNFSMNNVDPLDSRSTPMYYHADTLAFDGVVYLQTYGTTGNDGTGITFSFWVNVDIASSGGYIFEATVNGRIYCSIQGNTPYVYIYNTSGTAIQRIIGIPGSVPSSEWVHVLVSINSATQTQHLYVNDVDSLDTVLNNDTGTMGLAQQFNIGTNDSASDDFLLGDLSELFIYYGYLDLTIANIRAQFYDPIEKRPPGNLLLTTGLVPQLYVVDHPPQNIGNTNMSISGANQRGSSSPSDTKAV